VALSRRAFLGTTAAAGLAGLVRVEGQTAASARRVFRHGVASGDPLSDRVILWTRVTTPDESSAAATEVTWELAADAAFRRPVVRGTTQTGWERDWTIKIDASGLMPSTTYYYRFVALGERSPVGRTRTLPARAAKHVRLAVASCSNYPYGFFNAYGRIAERADLDAVLHLGDYIYEYENARYGDGTPYGRVSNPNREIIALWDYRTRHAQYKTDPDLQEAHRQHPWIVVWDDHEVANNTWRDGAENHQPDRGEGHWLARRDAAVQAFFEWMPIREDRATRQPRIYRTFPFGGLVDLIMLDTRVIDRDEQAAGREEVSLVDDPSRSLLGRTQEQWLQNELSESKRAGVQWQMLGQQVMFAPLSLPGAATVNTDTWEGYRPSRQRLIDALDNHKLANVVVLTGDVHSSWGYDVPRDPWGKYDAATGRGSLAIEIVAPSITSPSGFGTPEEAAARVAKLRKERPHLKYVDGTLRGYVVVDVTRERAQADWYYVPTVTEQTKAEQFGKGLVSAAGNPHLSEVSSPVATRPSADPAP
jgi:alkaline phosphatase D